ncbi:30S ribosomal protein S14 [Candidatus Woesearchaeota archaeon]|nr:30S ribosomal protein S14 [Candidatus Woesearchaeota archaeon]
MTASHYTKVLKQIGHKKGRLEAWKKHNVPKPRKFGSSTKRCVRCLRYNAHITKYGLHLCRQCFREVALELGFKKYS